MKTSKLYNKKDWKWGTRKKEISHYQLVWKLKVQGLGRGWLKPTLSHAIFFYFNTLFFEITVFDFLGYNLFTNFTLPKEKSCVIKKIFYQLSYLEQKIIVGTMFPLKSLKKVTSLYIRGSQAFLVGHSFPETLWQLIFVTQ
jgi:hypothetical protein